MFRSQQYLLYKLHITSYFLLVEYSYVVSRFHPSYLTFSIVTSQLCLICESGPSRLLLYVLSIRVSSPHTSVRSNRNIWRLILQLPPPSTPRTTAATTHCSQSDPPVTAVDSTSSSVPSFLPNPTALSSANGASGPRYRASLGDVDRRTARVVVRGNGLPPSHHQRRLQCLSRQRPQLLHPGCSWQGQSRWSAGPRSP